MSWSYPKGGGPYTDPLPDCRNGGPHRFKQAHTLQGEKKVLYQTCRVCGAIKYTRYSVKDGRIHTEDISPGPLVDHLSDGKSLPDNGVSNKD